MKNIHTVTVTGNKNIADGIYAMTLRYKEEEAPEQILPGQFVGVYSKDSARLLPRPISICRWISEDNSIVLVYRVVGAGTEEFASCKKGDTLQILDVLGNGYDLESLKDRSVLLVGGGIGAPPLLELAGRITAENIHEGKGSVTTALGYRTNDLFLKKDFEQVSRVLIATDDGTAGFHGNAVDAVRTAMEKNERLRFDVICACGPLPMLRAVKKLARDLSVPAFLSLEERMACGVGACLGCVVKTVKTDPHSHVKNARICTEGPVFLAEDVDI